MKFLVDAQLPKSLSDPLNMRGCDSVHTLELQNKNSTTDNIIVEIAIQQNRNVISKDHDFLDSFLLNSKPEKLILVRLFRGLIQWRQV